jgi:hypothetical protein
MSQIQCVYDTQVHTWNVMQDKTCLFFGSIDGLEQWLIDHKDSYKE